MLLGRTELNVSYKIDEIGGGIFNGYLITPK
jgi:hypothetical protein